MNKILELISDMLRNKLFKNLFYRFQINVTFEFSDRNDILSLLSCFTNTQRTNHDDISHTGPIITNTLYDRM